AENCQLAPYLAAVGKCMPPPPPGAPGPFALSAPGALETLARKAAAHFESVFEADATWEEEVAPEPRK
ncbi:MAG: hypothetical protein ACRELY_02705, partial [Polyangiaceae bacterium]